MHMLVVLAPTARSLDEHKALLVFFIVLFLLYGDSFKK